MFFIPYCLNFKSSQAESRLEVLFLFKISNSFFLSNLILRFSSIINGNTILINSFFLFFGLSIFFSSFGSFVNWLPTLTNLVFLTVSRLYPLSLNNSSIVDALNLWGFSSSSFFPKTSISSKIFHEYLSVIESLILLLFFFCLSITSIKFCFEELSTTSSDLKLFFIKLTEFGKTENKKIKTKLVSNTLKKLRLLSSYFFIKLFFFHISLDFL